MSPAALGCSRRPRRAHGASLIEILVAVLVLSLGLLGLASMQVRALRALISSEQRTQAVALIHSLLEVMRVDRASALGGDYNTLGGTATPLCTLPPAPAAGLLAQAQLREWLDDAKDRLGPGQAATTCAVVACDAQGVCSVRLQWDDRAAGGPSDQSVTVTSRL
ncbi:MAG: type pilus modification protein PilV [Pseudomonadota bacterium]